MGESKSSENTEYVLLQQTSIYSYGINYLFIYLSLIYHSPIKLNNLINRSLVLCCSALIGGLRVLVLLVQIIVSFAVVLLICWLLRSHLIGPFYRKLHAESKGNKEILVLGTAAFVFLMLTVSVCH